MEYYKDLESGTFFDEYKKRSVVLGREITVIGPGESRRATALDIDRDCGLRVRYEDGTEAVLHSGEIRVHL